jgi:hypothetical protein
MTFDKIKYYLGSIIVDHINRANQSELELQKAMIEKDIELLNTQYPGSEILFKRNVELKFINSRLNNQ